MTTNEPIEAVLIGAGGRGTFAYGAYALGHPEDVRFTAVAEPDAARRARFAAQHNVPPERTYERWEDLIAAGPLAPALVCCTGDRLHVAPTLAALEMGYQVLLEKPMAVTPEDCVRLAQASEQAERLLMICHVMRYTPFYKTLHGIVTSGRLGEIVAVEHRENVAYWHMAHSFVRGNWSNAEKSSPMILQKCCHDLDILVWMLADHPIKRLQSFGSLLHFRTENRPPGAPPRCTDGCPVADDCAFYAPRQYLTDDVGWPTSAISADPSHAARLYALQTGPYGRCVYQSDNDVVDHQVVTMEHDNGALTTLVMHGHSHEEGRTMRYDGTRATLRASAVDGEQPQIAVYDHRYRTVEHIPIPQLDDEYGHGGGDAGVMQAFKAAVQNPSGPTLTSARNSLEGHLLAFAAEESRAIGAIVDMDIYRKKMLKVSSE